MSAFLATPNHNQESSLERSEGKANPTKVKGSQVSTPKANGI